MKEVQTLAKGQVVIPADVRHQLEIEPGTPLSLSVIMNSIVLTPLLKNPLHQAFGLFSGRGNPSRELAQEHRKELQREHRRSRR